MRQHPRELPEPKPIDADYEVVTADAPRRPTEDA